jgi:hypothetical protein
MSAVEQGNGPVIFALKVPGTLYYVDPGEASVLCNAPQLEDGSYEVPETTEDGTVLRGGTDLDMCCPSISAQDRLAAVRLHAVDGCELDDLELVIGQARSFIASARDCRRVGYSTDLSLEEQMAPMDAPLVRVDVSTMRIVETA